MLLEPPVPFSLALIHEVPRCGVLRSSGLKEGWGSTGSRPFAWAIIPVLGRARQGWGRGPCSLCNTSNFCAIVGFAGDGLSSVGLVPTKSVRMRDYRPLFTGRVKCHDPGPSL